MMWDCECRPSKAPKGTKRAPLAVTNHPHPFKHRIEGQVSCGVCTCVVPPATPRPISGPQLLQLLQLRSCLSRRGAAGPRRSLGTPVWRSNRIRVLPSGNPDDNATGWRLVWQTRRWKKILRGWGDGISDGDGGSLACLSHWQFGVGIGIASHRIRSASASPRPEAACFALLAMRAPRPLRRNAAPFTKRSRARFLPACQRRHGRIYEARCKLGQLSQLCQRKPQSTPGASKHQRMGVAWRRNMGELGGL